MIEYIIKLLCISLIVLSEASLARNFDIKQQKHFFCLLEKYNQCFYSGQCSQKEYIKYTNYFNNLIEYNSDAGIELYKEIPKIYEKSEDHQDQNNKGSQLKNFYIGRLLLHYGEAKYDWLNWFNNQTGISYQKPKNIFSFYEQNRCGAKMFKKYLSLSLSENAAEKTCFMNKSFVIPDCEFTDIVLRRKLFCKYVENCDLWNWK